MVKIKSRKFIYKNFIKWCGQKKGVLSSFDKPKVEIATPHEFGGHFGIWTPEDLLVASVNSCIMTTFLFYAKKENLEFLSYESEAEGVLERVGNHFIFSEIKIRPQILVKQDTYIQKAKELMKLSEKNCFISNSIKSKVEIIPEIKI
jgi:peroxiredoxin-like protein